VGLGHDKDPPRHIFEKPVNKNAIKHKIVYPLEILSEKQSTPGILEEIRASPLPPGFSTVWIYNSEADHNI
jgi:hypothetical protein